MSDIEKDEIEASQISQPIEEPESSDRESLKVEIISDDPNLKKIIDVPEENAHAPVSTIATEPVEQPKSNDEIPPIEIETPVSTTVDTEALTAMEGKVEATHELQFTTEDADAIPNLENTANAPESVGDVVESLADDETVPTSDEKEGVSSGPVDGQPDLESSLNEPSIDDLRTSLQSEESKLAKQIENLNARATSPPLPPRVHPKPELPAREVTASQVLSEEPSSMPEKKTVHSVPPPLSEELENESFRKNLALSHARTTPPVLPPRKHKRSESADFDLIISRFHDNEDDYLSKDETAKEDIQEGARVLKSSYTAILEGLNNLEEEQETNEEEHKELNQIDWPFWTKLVNNYADVAKNDSITMEKEVAAGIPPQIRDIIWQLMANSKSKEIEGLYTDLLEKHSEHEKSINRDLLRTKFIPENKTGALFNVIKAYSLFDPEVGYIQGMAFITTPLLLNVETESEAFGLLISLMKNYGLRELFLPDMPGLHLKLYQFDRLVEENSPTLYNHLVRQGVRSSMYASQWFLTFFAYKFPLGFVLRIFDIVFAEGIESILKFGVILMLKNEDVLVQLQFDQLLDFLKNGLFAYYLKENVKSRDEMGSEIEQSNSSSSIVHSTSSKNTQIQELKDVKDEDYAIDAFVNDAIREVKITPLTLKRYVAEYKEIHEIDLQKEAQFESLRIKNKQLHNEVRKLENDYTLLNREHINIANELIANRLKIETLQDENNDLKEMIKQLKNQLNEEVRKQSLPNPDSELPTDIRTDLENTMARNLEVMNQNQELQEKIIHLEREIDILKGSKNPLERVASPLKAPNWGGLKKVWK